MFVGGVVHHHVHDDANVVLFCLSDEVVEVGEGPVLRVDVFVVGDVVAEIDLGRWVDGGEPDGIDTERLQIVEPLDDAVEVADAVAVGILKASWIDLIDDGVFPPGIGRSMGGNGCGSRGDGGLWLLGPCNAADTAGEKGGGEAEENSARTADVVSTICYGQFLPPEVSNTLAFARKDFIDMEQIAESWRSALIAEL